MKEEVGLDCKIISSLPTTYHAYMDKGILVIKETAWYRMRCDQAKVKLQASEDIIAHKWVHKADFIKMKSKILYYLLC